MGLMTYCLCPKQNKSYSVVCYIDSYIDRIMNVTNESFVSSKIVTNGTCVVHVVTYLAL